MSYKNTNCSSFLILFKLLLLLIFCSADLAASIPCPEECGGIAMRYPFGIGKGCYLDKYYEIECRSTTTSRKLVPFLSVINKEVVNISLPRAESYYAYSPELHQDQPFGVVRVKYPITSAGCFSHGNESGGPIMNFTDSPFFIDSTNSLIAVGCNSKVSLTYIKPKMVGCELNCNTSKVSYSNSIPFVDNTGCSSNVLSYFQDQDCEEKKPEDTECNGNGCCQASLPNEPQQVIGIRTESNDGNSTREKQCTVAFLTDEIYTLLNASKTEQVLAKGYATVSLGWVIQTKNNSFLNSLACKNEEYNYDTTHFAEPERKCTCARSTISAISYANCKCTYGYTGNPYRLDGCKGQYMFLPYALFLLLSFTNHLCHSCKFSFS